MTVGPRARDLWAGAVGVVPAAAVLVLATLLDVRHPAVLVLAAVSALAAGTAAVLRARTVVGPEGVDRRELLRAEHLPWDRVLLAAVGRWERPGTGGPGSGTGETWLYVTGQGVDGTYEQVPLVSTRSLRRLEASRTRAGRRSQAQWRSAIAALEARGLMVRASPQLAREELAAFERLRAEQPVRED